MGAMITLDFENSARVRRFVFPRHAVQEGLFQVVQFLFFFYFFSPCVLDIEDVHNAIPQSRDPCEVDIAATIRQSLCNLIEDSHSILSRQV